MKNLAQNIPKLVQKEDKVCSPELLNLISIMLSFSPLKRPNINQIKKHAWFSSINFNELAKKKCIPPKGCLDLLNTENESQFFDPWKEW